MKRASGGPVRLATLAQGRFSARLQKTAPVPNPRQIPPLRSSVPPVGMTACLKPRRRRPTPFPPVPSTPAPLPFRPCRISHHVFIFRPTRCHHGPVARSRGVPLGPRAEYSQSLRRTFSKRPTRLSMPSPPGIPTNFVRSSAISCCRLSSWPESRAKTGDSMSTG